jgi:hypothetical protein
MNAKFVGPQAAAGNHLHESLVERAAKCASGGTLVSRRCSPRWLVRTPVILRYSTPDGAPHLVEAQIEDLSTTGVGLRCHESVPLDIPAEVLAFFRDGQCRSRVTVVHSAKDILGFRIGCRFVTST